MNSVLGTISTTVFLFSAVCTSILWLILLLTQGINVDLATLPAWVINLMKTLGAGMGVTLVPATITIKTIIDE